MAESTGCRQAGAISQSSKCLLRADPFVSLFDPAPHEKTRYELVLIDNLAILTVKHTHPHVLKFFSKETQNLAFYLDMPARELVDFIFKNGARFNNQEAVSVAIHRGLVENINNESQAYEKLASIERRLEGKQQS